MTSFTQVIEKLIRRIKRAFSKGKENKVERLTSELNILLKQQEHDEENTVVETPPSNESSESESSESESSESESSESESEQEGSNNKSHNSEEGVIDDEPSEEDYLAGKLEQGEEE